MIGAAGSIGEMDMEQGTTAPVAGSAESGATSGTDAHRDADTHRGWTRARALLAGGLVLGVGAAITLAAWTDQEWATGLFGSGSFGIEGSANGGAFAEHPTEGAAATIDFTVAADTLAPGDVVYGSFGVQLIAAATNEAEVTVSTDVSEALPGTTASYVYTTDAACDAAAYSAGANENATSFDLTAPEAPVYLCFAVTADNTLPQGESGSFTWTFDAVSGDAL